MKVGADAGDRHQVARAGVADLDALNVVTSAQVSGAASKAFRPA
jgi:hypothetical protein